MRIAHITDLHLRQALWGTCAVTARLGRMMPQLLAQALEQIKKQQVDLVAVTGDLLDVPGWIERPPCGFEMDDPKRWVQAAIQDYRLVKKLLDASGLEYMVLPGNHDFTPAMWQVFDENDNQRQIDGYQIARFCDFEHDNHQPRRFDTQRLRWEKFLEDSSFPQIHLQHYVITPALNAGYPHTYKEGENMALRMVSSQAGGGADVRLSLSGHYHKGTPLLGYGKTTFTTGQAFCQAPFPWRVYEIEDDHVSMETRELGQSALPQKPVIYLDRDGVINDLASYRTGAQAMRLVPGSAKAIKKLNDAGYRVAVITNQSCVGMGYVPHGVLAGVNDKMCRLLAEQGAYLDNIYCSYGAGHSAALPDFIGTDDVKPSTTLLQRGKAELNLTWQGGWMAGDSVSDIQTALNAGIAPILVRTGNGKTSEPQVRKMYPDVPVADNLLGAVEKILTSRA